MTKRERREQREAEREFQKKLKRYYMRPIEQHLCGSGCKMVPGMHKRQEIWDDFQLSQRKREVIDIEVIRSRGRLNKEMILIRQFQSTLDGSFIIRLNTATLQTAERIGEIVFESREDCQDYYNNAIRVFEFTEVSPVRSDIDDFFVDPDDLDSFFDTPKGKDLDDFFGDSEKDLDNFFDDGPKDDLDDFFD